MSRSDDTPNGRTEFDAIVLGLGGVGSATLFHLARRGRRVLGIDRFPPGHDRGSSHGETRIIRQAYFEHPDYVPLLLRAYELWEDLEVRRGERLLFPCGLVQIGPPDGEVLPGVLKSAALHRLPVEQFTSAEAAGRFPGLFVPAEMGAVFEPRAGYLLVEKCVVAHVEEAVKAGAQIVIGDSILDWRVTGSESSPIIVVDTTGGQFRARSLVVAAGAWTASLLRTLSVPLRVLLKPLHWFACDDGRYEESDCPAFLYETANGVYYGFPRIDGRSVKVARHDGGEAVIDPLQPKQEVDEAERASVQRFIAGHLPGVSQTAVAHAVCMYTMSPDGHFIVDRASEAANVVFAAGLSGHGFKFTSVLGEVLANLACGAPAGLPIEFLGAGRFSTPTAKLG